MLRRNRLSTWIAAGLLAALLVPPATAADDLDLDTLLDRHFEAIGGKEAWKNVESAEIRGKMILSGGQMEAPFSLRIKRPGKARLEFTLQGMTGVQATDGETYWMVMPFMGQTGPERMADDQAKQFARQAEFDSELIDWKDKGHTVELIGPTEIDGTPVYEILLTRADGDEQRIFLDAEYYVPIRMRSVADAQGMTLEVDTDIGDYKQVGDLLMAHSMESFAKGSDVPMQTVIVESVEFDVDLGDDLFAMPEAEVPEAETPEPADGNDP